MGVYLSAGALCFRFFSLNPYKPPCCPLCFFMLAVFQGFLFSTPPTYFFLFFFLQPPLNPSHPLGTPWGFLGQLFPLFPYSFPFTPPAPLEPLGFCLEQSLNFYPLHFPLTPLKPFSPSGNPLGPPCTTFPPFSLFFPFHPSGPSGTPWVLSGIIPPFFTSSTTFHKTKRAREFPRPSACYLSFSSFIICRISSINSRRMIRYCIILNQTNKANPAKRRKASRNIFSMLFHHSFEKGTELDRPAPLVFIPFP